MTAVQTPVGETTNMRVENEGDRKWQYFWLMLLAVSLPMLIAYLSTLWAREAYRYFPFVLLGVGSLAYTRWDRQFHPPCGWLGWTLIGFGFAATTLAALIASPWLSAVGFVFVCTAFLASSRGEDDPSLIGLALPLLMLVNLPLGYDQLLVIRLQHITTSLSSVLLDCLAIPNAVANNVIQLTTRELFVAEACSGIQSVFTLMFLATLLVAAYRRLLWLAPLYLIIAVILAIFANVLRVTTVAIGDAWLGIDLAEGWQHELVGYVGLGLGALLLLSFDQLIVSVLHPVESTGFDGDRNPLMRCWNFLVGSVDSKGQSTGPIVLMLSNASRKGAGLWQRIWPRRGLMALASVVAIASVSQAVHLLQPVKLFPLSNELLFIPDPKVFEDKISDLKIVKHEVAREGSNPRLGQNADIWECHFDDLDLDAQFVLSQPHTEWHALCLCYEIIDWMLLSRDVRHYVDPMSVEDDDAVKPTPYVLARFKRGNSQFGYLFYSAVDRSANFIKPPPRPGRLGRRLFEYLYETEVVPETDVAMIQMFVTTPTRLRPEDLGELNEKFVMMRDIIQQDLRGRRDPTSDEADTVASDDLSQSSTDVTQE